MESPRLRESGLGWLRQRNVVSGVILIVVVAVTLTAASCAGDPGSSARAPSSPPASEACIDRDAVHDGLADVQSMVGEFSLDRAAEAAETVASVADEVEEVAPDAAAKFRDAASGFESVVQARGNSDPDAGLPQWANAVRSITQGVDELESLTTDSFCKLPTGTD